MSVQKEHNIEDIISSDVQQEIEDAIQAFLETKGLARNLFTLVIETEKGTTTIERNIEDQLTDDLEAQALHQSAVDIARAITEAAKARKDIADAALADAQAKFAQANANFVAAQEDDKITDINIQKAQALIDSIQSKIASHKAALLDLDTQLEVAIFALEEANIADAKADEVLDKVAANKTLAEEDMKLAKAADDAVLADVIAAQKAQEPLEKDLAEITMHVNAEMPHHVKPVAPVVEVVLEETHDSSDDEEAIPELVPVEPVTPVMEISVTHDSSDDEEVEYFDTAPIETVPMGSDAELN